MEFKILGAECLIASDPSEGVHIVTPRFTRYLTSIQSEEEEARYPAFGKIDYLAINAKRTMCAVLCRSDSGQARLIVTTADFSGELNRQNLPTAANVKGLYWCGSSCIVLVY